MKQVQKKIALRLLTLSFLLTVEGAIGASISGHAAEANGEGLNKVSICLSLASTPDECHRVKWTDKKGDYTFNGLKPDLDYIVTVNGDSKVSNRKFEQHANYVWEPSAHATTIYSMKDKLTVADFTGTFNFSNFQRILSLSAADFPELSSLDLAGTYVVLKVFIHSGMKDATPETIFLGRVHNSSALKIRASVPLAKSTIEYEIFSSSVAVSGSIALAAP